MSVGVDVVVVGGVGVVVWEGVGGEGAAAAHRDAVEEEGGEYHQ